MGFLLGFLGACLGIIAGIFIIVLIVYFKVKGAVGADNMKEIMKAAKSAGDIEKQEYTREKNLSGITKLLEPVIVKDFGDFNKDLLFKKLKVI